IENYMGAKSDVIRSFKLLCPLHRMDSAKIDSVSGIQQDFAALRADAFAIYASSLVRSEIANVKVATVIYPDGSALSANVSAADVYVFRIAGSDKMFSFIVLMRSFEIYILFLCRVVVYIFALRARYYLGYNIIKSGVSSTAKGVTIDSGGR